MRLSTSVPSLPSPPHTTLTQTPHTCSSASASASATVTSSSSSREWHPITMGAAVLDALVEQTGISAAQAGMIDDVIVGCVSQSGGQAGNVGRNMILSSRLIPEHVPGTAVDRQCGSSQQAIHFAAQAVMSGTQDVVIAAGVEHMSSVPIGSNVADAYKAGHGLPMDQVGGGSGRGVCVWEGGQQEKRRIRGMLARNEREIRER